MHSYAGIVARSSLFSLSHLAISLGLVCIQHRFCNQIQSVRPGLPHFFGPKIPCKLFHHFEQHFRDCPVVGLLGAVLLMPLAELGEHGHQALGVIQRVHDRDQGGEQFVLLLLDRQVREQGFDAGMTLEQQLVEALYQGLAARRQRCERFLEQRNVQRQRCRASLLRRH